MKQLSPLKTGLVGKLRKGSILVLAAILLTVIFGFCAFSIDCGYISLVKSQLQNAADAAALASANSFSDKESGSNLANHARQVAKDIASQHQAGCEPVILTNQQIELGTWDEDSATFTAYSGTNEANADTVRVTCQFVNLPLFFAPVIGVDSASPKAQAIARVKPSRCGLFIGLKSVSLSGSSLTDSYNADMASYDQQSPGKKGHVCSNGMISMSGSTGIYGNAHPGVGQTVKCSSKVGVLGVIQPLKVPISFPPVDPKDATWNNDNADIPKSDGGTAPLNSKGEFTLSGGDGVDLPPGTYYFSKMALSGGASIRITGPTKIFVTGDCSLSGGSVLNETTLPKNLELLAMGSKCTISGSAAFYGVVYAPTAKVERSGTADYYGSIIGNELVLSGSGGMHADESLNINYLASGSSTCGLVD